MSIITYQGKQYSLLENETVLDGLLRNQESVSFSCRSGKCQACMLKAVEGQPPAAAQKELKETLKAQNYFLACQCVPEEDLVVGGAECTIDTKVVRKSALNEHVIQLLLEPSEPFEYRAGQYVQLIRDDGLTRSYSIAVHPEDPYLEFHIKRIRGGEMSNWIHDSLEDGDSLQIRGPAGDCFYVPGNTEQPILLAGTGTGLAPLWGIARDALRQGHCGPIHLFHGALNEAGLYHVAALSHLAVEYPNFSYHPCVLHGESGNGLLTGDLSQNLFTLIPALEGWRVYLCGDPDFVTGMRKKAFLRGASMREIFADAFLMSVPQNTF